MTLTNTTGYNIASLELQVKKSFEYNFLRRTLYALKNDTRLKILKILREKKTETIRGIKALIFDKPYSFLNFQRYYITPLYESGLIHISENGVSISKLG
ncbi:MAG: hypothetical protein ACTSQY_06240, partial [Candidatus Odinarchaeia archaeon]